MPDKSLTKATLKLALAAGVPDGKAHIVIWDAKPKGLGLKLRASGSASWVFVYRPRGSPKGTPARTVTLGSWPTVDLDEARREAAKLAGRVAGGGDPAHERRQQRQRARSRLSTALDGYEQELTRRQVVAKDAAMSALRRGLAPLLGEEIGTIDQPQLIARITAIATRIRRRKDGSTFTTPGAAADFRKHAHAFLAWCVSVGLTRHNALAGYRIPRQTREELLSGGRPGKALTDPEIQAVWQASLEAGSFGGLIRLALLTGLRRNELAELEWRDVQTDAIVIPASRSKMARQHLVPLTPLMHEVLAVAPQSSERLVFPSEATHAVMSGWSQRMQRLVTDSSVAFRIHDLRRTCRTLMSRCGVDEAVAELAIGHIRRGLIGVYNKDLMWPARVTAFARVSEHIAGLVHETSGETTMKVVRLRSR